MVKIREDLEGGGELRKGDQDRFHWVGDERDPISVSMPSPKAVFKRR